MHIKRSFSPLLLWFFFNSFLFHCSENVLEQLQNFSPNTSPEIISFSSDSPGAGLVTPGQNINITFSASDAHKNSFTADITSTQGFFGTKSETWNNDILSFTVPFAVTEPAINTPIMVTIILTDEKGATADYSYDLGTILPNGLPVILSMTPSSTTKIWDSVNATYGATLEPNNQFTIVTTAEDPQNDAITFQYSSLIGTFSPSTEVPTGTGNMIQSTVTFYISNNVTPGFIGDLTVTVTDSRGGVVTQNYIIGTGRLGPILAQNTQLPPLIPYISNNAFQSASFTADANGFFQYNVQTTTPCAMNTSLTGTFIFYTAGTPVNIDLIGATYNGIGSGALLSMPLPAIDGLYYLCIGVMDSLQQSGYLGGANGISIYVDNTPPATTIAAGTMPAGAYTSPVTLNFTCSDATAGCSKTIYTLNQVFDSVTVLNPPTAPTFNATGGIVNGALYADQIAGTTAPILLTDGARTAISVASIDKAGSVEPVQTFNYTVDTTVPVITINAASTSVISSVAGYDIATLTWSTNRTSLNYTIKSGTDCTTGTALAGLAGATPATANTNVTNLINAAQLATGANTIWVCVDNLAALTGSSSHVITRDNTPPAISLTPLPGNFTTATNLVMGCTDTGGSTCAVTGYTKSTSTIPALPAAPATPALVAATKTVAAGTTQYTAPVALADGAQTLFSYIAMDNVGNISTVSTTSAPYIVDTALPTVTVSGTTVNGVSSTLLGVNNPYDVATITWSTNRTNLNYTVKSGTCATGTPVANSTAMATPNLSGTTPATANTAVTTLINQADLGAGANSISICVSNLANSDGFAATIITKDSIAPTISITPITGNYFVSSLSFAITCSDDALGSGCKDTDYYIGGTGPIANYTPGTTTVTGTTANGTVTHANGCTATTYTLNYAARDNVLNLATGFASYTITDCIRINLSMVAPATYTPNSLSVTLTNATTALNSGAVPIAATGLNTVSGVSFAIGDTYNIAVAGQPANQICSFKDKQFGTITAAGGLTFNINCINGYMVGGRYQALPAAPLNYNLYQSKVAAIAGGGTGGGTCNGASTTCNDGIGTAAQFNFPQYMEHLNGFLYVGDTNNHLIRKIDLATNTVTTLAGTGVAGVGTTADDGPCLSAKFNAPNGIVTDGTNLYVANYSSNTIQKISDINGTCTVTTLAGGNTATTGLTCGGIGSTTCNDGTGSAAKFLNLRQMVLSGNFIYAADLGNHRIRKIDISSGAVTTLAGSGTAADANGTGNTANIKSPEGLALIGTTLYTFTFFNHIMAIDINSGAATIVAGDGTAGYMDSTGLLSKFNWSPSMTTDGYNLYLVEINNQIVRRIDVRNNYKATTLAGYATNAGNVTGIGVNARFNIPHGIVTDGRNLFVANHTAHTIVKLSDNGLVGYWPLAGNPNDYSSDNLNQNNGSAAPGYTSGRFNETSGSALFTANTQQITGFDTGLPTGGSSRTLCAWVKPTSLPAAGVYAIINSYGSTAPAGSGNGLGLQGGSRVVFFGYGGGAATDLSVSYTVSVTSWTHICGTYKGGVATIFINGHQVGSNAGYTWNTTLGGTSTSMKIGQQLAVTNSGFIGSIADVRIYNRALSEGEINELAQDAAAAQVGNSYNTAATGLLSHYSFDGAANGANATDSGPLNLLETNTGTTTATVGKDGDTNGAYNLNGTTQNFVNSTPYGLPLGNHPRTMCGWMNPSALPAINTHAYIAAYGNSVTPALNSAFAIGIYKDDGTNMPAGTYIVNAIQGSTMAADNLVLTSIPLNTWSHICAVYDGTNSILYYDGKQLGTKALSLVTALNSLNTPTLTIGSYTASNERFSGKIDDVRIYNRALSANQIRQLAVQVPSGLVARYDFTGDAIDVSGFADNTLTTITGATATTDRFGKGATAYSFNGTAHKITVSDAALPSGSSERTLCSWIYPTTPNANAGGFIHYGTPSATAGQANGLSYTNAKVITYYGYNSDNNSTTVVPLNTWHHVCGTFAANSSKIYLNGNLISTVTPATAWNTIKTGTMTIGLLNDFALSGINKNFIGSIDDVRVYNRALPLNEIQALVQQPNKIFRVTANTFDGSMKQLGVTAGTGATGIAKADNWCQTEFGTRYKAMLVDNTPNRKACTSANCATSGITENIDWVLRPNITYLKSDGITPLFTTNWQGVAIVTLLNSGTMGEVWTGLTASWTSSAASCTNWTSNLISVTAPVGDSTGAANFLIRYAQTCERANVALYCVEQ